MKFIIYVYYVLKGKKEESSNYPTQFRCKLALLEQKFRLLNENDVENNLFNFRSKGCFMNIFNLYQNMMVIC